MTYIKKIIKSLFFILFPFAFFCQNAKSNKNEILNNFRERIKNETSKEFNEAKKQVKRIASFRLSEIIN